MDIGSTGTATLTVTQAALNGFTGTVTYRVYGNESQPLPIFGYQDPATVAVRPSRGTITELGTLVLTITTTGAPAGSEVFYVWGSTTSQIPGQTGVLGHTVPATLAVS